MRARTTTHQVVQLTDETQIAPVLSQDRRWAAYALCDLEPSARPHSRFLGAVGTEGVTAVILIYSPPGFTSLIPCGDGDGVRAIIQECAELPQSTLVLARHSDLAALQQRYHLEKSWVMLRMVVTPADFRPAPEIAATVAPLSVDSLAELATLYAHHPETVFQPSMLEGGVYFGGYKDGTLVAVAGTHAISPRYHIAVVGNVFTHPGHRNQGLAAATTAAVTEELVRRGAHEVVLNVRQDNAAAIAAYRRIGFGVHCSFVEGEASLR